MATGKRIRRVVRLATLLMSCLLAGTSLRADDLADLQGSWESEVKQQGATLKVVKTIVGQQETVEVFDKEKLVHRHVVLFSIEEHGDAKIFRYPPGQVTFGPRNGKELPGGAYLHRVKDDQWIAVFGMLKGDTGKVHAQVFRRVPPVQ